LFDGCGPGIHEVPVRDSVLRSAVVCGYIDEVLQRERARIARELHDSVGASLSAIKYGLEYALARLENAAVGDASEVLGSAVTGVRDTMRELRSITSALDDREAIHCDVLRALSIYCSAFEDLHPDIVVESRIEVRGDDVPAAVKPQLLLMVKEAMCNAVRHGGSTRILVSVSLTEADLRLSIEDNGCGFDNLLADATGLGLHSTRERARSGGGTLAITSAPGQGTRINVVWPL
jgi:signal transduction histidine kinase